MAILTEPLRYHYKLPFFQWLYSSLPAGKSHSTHHVSCFNPMETTIFPWWNHHFPTISPSLGLHLLDRAPRSQRSSRPRSRGVRVPLAILAMNVDGFVGWIGIQTIGKLWENHRKTIGTWWINGLLWDLPLWILGKFDHDLTVLPSPGNYGVFIGKSSPFMALFQKNELL